MSYAALFIVMLVAGIGIPVMAAMNGELGKHINNGAAASAIVFALALIISIGFTMATQQNHKVSFSLGLPFHYYLGGLLVAFYVLSITWIGPKIGLTNAIFLVLVGQIISSAIIEYAGLFGVAKQSPDWMKISAILLMIAGVTLNYLAKISAK